MSRPGHAASAPGSGLNSSRGGTDDPVPASRAHPRAARVTVHESRVTSAQQSVEPPSDSLDKSVDITY
jgi:hypothetical protein